MEIRVRTAEEIAADRMTIEVNGARLYTAAEVGDAQASEAELVAAPLRHRIEELEARLEKGHVCTEACRPNAHVAFLGRKRLDEAEAEASEARRRVIELTAELAEQRQRADANQAWAERAEGRVSAYGLDLSATRRKLADAERAIQILSAQLSGAIYSPEVVSALRRVYETWEPRIMGEAIRKVRDALGSPSLPEAASEPTSQA